MAIVLAHRTVADSMMFHELVVTLSLLSAIFLTACNIAYHPHINVESQSDEG